ncbi:MAG TPA: vWA domain-containing protein [Myxococcales bacterium]|nr:vWA domain-containing protein [Myxococcales bacterium]
MQPALRSALLLLALAALSCDSAPADALTSCQATEVVPDSVATDILFVVDDSGSMSEEQANLAANLGAFIDTLAASPVKNEFRIGVTNSSVEEYTVNAISYTSGPSAGVPYPAGALLAIKTDAGGNAIPGSLVYDASLYAQTGGWGGQRILDKGSPTLVADFKANVRVGLNGSGKEQPFRAARLALSDRLLDANKGFLRDGARLAIVFLTDEDDCSDSADPRATSNGQCHDKAVKNASPPVLDAVGDFASFLLGPVGGEPRDVAVGVIGGFDPASLQPSCGDSGICPDTSCATALDEGDRFTALAAALGPERTQLGSICDASFRDSLTRFAASLTPSTMPLAGAPADWRMLVVTLTKASGAVVPCTVGLDGTSADAVFSGPRAGRQAQITFQNACKLDLGDKIDVRVACAG